VTCEAGGEHGPYWYRRAAHQPTVEYLGVELPTTVTEAYSRVQQARPGVAQQIQTMKAQIAALEGQVKALEAFANHDRLTESDRAIIAACGLAAVLPPVITIESKRKKRNQVEEHQLKLS